MLELDQQQRAPREVVLELVDKPQVAHQPHAQPTKEDERPRVGRRARARLVPEAQRACAPAHEPAAAQRGVGGGGAGEVRHDVGEEGTVRAAQTVEREPAGEEGGVVAGRQRGQLGRPLAHPPLHRADERLELGGRHLCRVRIPVRPREPLAKVARAQLRPGGRARLAALVHEPLSHFDRAVAARADRLGEQLEERDDAEQLARLGRLPVEGERGNLRGLAREVRLAQRVEQEKGHLYRRPRVKRRGGLRGPEQQPCKQPRNAQRRDRARRQLGDGPQCRAAEARRARDEPLRH
mmetsp:Transcript_44208/g.103679  ORF Transcript_44208/g.103679 Transcript_44208/m.103679 type:complete len:294 (+) Transcript_44208:848-1729(+)